jgi:uncharacterized membrane protein
MLVTGVFWGTWFTLTRSLHEFEPAEFIHIGKVIISNVALPMRILMPLCILGMLISIWLYPDKRSKRFYFGIAACIFIIITLLITLLILVPIDNEIKTWTALTLPVDFNQTRNSWEFYHAMRTFTSVISFICFVLAMDVKS